MKLFKRANLFKTLIMHIIVAVLAFTAWILISTYETTYVYEELKYSYYLGYYYDYSYIYDILPVDFPTAALAVVVFVFVNIAAVLLTLPFMKRKYKFYKLFSGLFYTIGGGFGFIFMASTLGEVSSYKSYRNYEAPCVMGILIGLAIVAFGVILLTSKAAEQSQVQVSVQQSAPVYKAEPQQTVSSQPTQSVESKLESVAPAEEAEEGVVYKLKGAQKILRVYEDRVTLEIIKNARAVLTQTWFNGTKEIYYSDMLGIQYKPSGNLILGYIQFETASSRGGNNFGSENSWTYDYRTIPNETAKEVENYIREKVRQSKAPQPAAAPKASPAEELMKWKQLLDAGVIS